MPAPVAQRQFFGTDGIRGTANRPPLTADFVLLLGQAVGTLLIEEHVRKPFPVWPGCVIGKDTRVSGGMLESAFAAGLNSVGVDVMLAGVIPTPGIAFLTRDLSAALGAVISASHNLYPDNGIKLFGADGYKFDDARELEIERRVLAAEPGSARPPGKPPFPLATGGRIGRLAALEAAAGRYIAFALHSVAHEKNLLRGFKIALDNANGSASATSPAILRHLGAALAVVHSEPDGVNINESCGCTHPEAIRQAVIENRAHVGIAHDGDADRMLLCDENGDVLDGDEIMAIAAVAMLKEGALAQKTLVTTIMSNCGLDEAVEGHGGRILRAAVGDRYVMEKMRAENLNFGGEQSGHFVFRDHNTTGDGIIAALQILQIMASTGKPLSELRRVLTKYPQAQRNLSVREKPPIEELAEARTLIAETERALGKSGRVLLRYSGTEPKIRLLIEGSNPAWIEGQADAIAEAIARRIGA